MRGPLMGCYLCIGSSIHHGSCTSVGRKHTRGSRGGRCEEGAMCVWDSPCEDLLEASATGRGVLAQPMYDCISIWLSHGEHMCDHPTYQLSKVAFGLHMVSTCVIMQLIESCSCHAAMHTLHIAQDSFAIASFASPQLAALCTKTQVTFSTGQYAIFRSVSYEHNMVRTIVKHAAGWMLQACSSKYSVMQ